MGSVTPFMDGAYLNRLHDSAVRILQRGRPEAVAALRERVSTVSVGVPDYLLVAFTFFTYLTSCCLTLHYTNLHCIIQQ